MGGHVRFPVNVLDGIWEPHREALSSQVHAMREALAPGSPVVSFSAGQRSSVDFRGRVLRLSGRRDLLLRGLGAGLERFGRITHAFGSVDCWHFFKSLGRRPFLFTVSLPGRPLAPSLYAGVHRFVAETPVLAEHLRHAGVSPGRIEVVYPGIDLQRFSPSEVLRERRAFRIIFASTPSDPTEFEPRGIPLLIETARRRPEVEIVFLWRRWGNLPAAAAELERLRPPPNVTINSRDIPDMAAVYADADAVACCFAANFAKSAPNSVIEGLACGRPALLTDTCGIAPEVAAHSAGVGTPRAVDALVQGIDTLQANYPEFSRNARKLAERLFDRETCHREYARLYQQLGATPLTAHAVVDG